MYFIHPSADVDKTVKVGEGSKIWNNAQIRENAIIGSNCVIGKDVYIDHDVIIGDNCRIQNQALIYYNTEIGSNVFIGPQVCFANDRNPRAVFPDGKPKNSKDWQPGLIKVRTGASVGAGSIVLPGISVGEWAMIGAGSTVTKDVQAHELVFGSPAIFKGYVCKCGEKFIQKDNTSYVCQNCKRTFIVK